MCEGEVTEKAYFEAFPVTTVVVRVEGEGKNTTSLVAAAEAHADRTRFDAVWVVYDKDDFSAKQFNHAQQTIAHLTEVREEAWAAAWSNQAFELWYLLHFRPIDAQLHRAVLCEKLGEVLGGKYRKNDPTMYARLLPHQASALKQAKRLADLAQEGRSTPADANPCTLVFRLGEALNAEIR